LAGINYFFSAFIVLTGELKMGEKKERFVFSYEQNNLRGGIKCLLDLYNSQELSKPSKEWPKKAIFRYIAKFIERIFDGKLHFDKKINLFYILIKLKDGGRPKKKDIETKGTLFIFCHFILRITIEDLIIFNEIMKNFYKEIKESRFNHFVLAGIEDRIISDIDVEEKSKLNIYGEIEEADVADKETELMFVADEMKKIISPTVNDSAKEIISQNKMYNKKIDLSDQDLKFLVSSSRFRIFKVIPRTEFGRILLFPLLPKDEKIKIMKDEDIVLPIEDIFTMRVLPSFLYLIRLTLVHFHLYFDDYSKIKICKWCGGLIFENKKRKKYYCNDDCKNKFNKAVDPARGKCQEKQNRRIERLIEKIKEEHSFEAQKATIEDCRQCEDYMNPGRCKFISKRNKEAIDVFEKQIQKEKQGKIKKLAKRSADEKQT
jgi:hypothetical protein